MLNAKLDDPVWETAGKIDKLYPVKSDNIASETKYLLLHDKAWLYIGAQCANPNMEHVAQQVSEHDGAVHTDDSLEIFLSPGSDENAHYYHFMLNFANVGKEQRCNNAGMRDVGWNPPWRSETIRHQDGWTAELAIPLYCLESDNLSDLKINLCRNMTEVTLDAYGAKHSEKRVGAMIRPDSKGYHDQASFAPIHKMSGFKPDIPFAPRIAGGAVTGLVQEGGSNLYCLNLTLKLLSPTPGSALMKIMEDFGDGAVESFAQTVELQGDVNLEVKIPAGELRERRIKAVLTDPMGGNLLASAVIADTAALNVLKNMFAGRSFYSVEPTADIRVELGLPVNMLSQSVLSLEVGGTAVVKLNGLRSVMTPTIPLSALHIGDNAVTVRILKAGRELASKTINVVRLEPRPGFETKADFVRGVILKEQTPIFPIGICGHALQRRLGLNGCTEDDEALFKYLAEDIGLNMVVRGDGSTNAPAFMQMAKKYGLDVVTWTSPQPRPIGWTPGTWPPPPQTNSMAERIAFQKKWFEELKPEIIEDTKVLRDFDNLIGYYNVDEPNLVNPEERIAAAEWYWQTVKPLDPYRPFMLLYARHIPNGDNWTRWGDILGYDVYPCPYKNGFHGEPGLSTSYYAWELRERCRRDRKVMWFVPLSNQLDPSRSPVGLSKPHMLCQAYSAIIYGARGFIYFTISAMVGPDAWNALRDISAQIKEMTPALVNGDVPQVIRYTPDDFAPRERKFPMVNAAVFQYPDGDYLLLAANIMPHAVDAKFQVGGMEHAARMFAEEGQRGKWAEGQRGKGTEAQRILEFNGEAFADKIEPYGTRAYRLQLAGKTVPVKVAVEMTPVDEDRAPSVDIPGIVRQLMMSKNHIPNPCFEQQTNPGVPDFYRPYFCLSVDPFWGQKGKSDWFVDEAVLWNGRPSLRMLKRDLAAGGFKTRGMFFVAYPPPSDKPVKMTFSFFARSEDAKSTLWFRIDGVQPVTIGNLTADWQRHHFSFELPPGSSANMGARQFLMTPSAGSVIWISGLQLEKGGAPTEFQDDSVLLKKKVVIDPDNIITNPGAESGSAEGWDGLEFAARGEFGVQRGQGRSGEYAFCWRGQSDGIFSDWIEVDTNRSYELSAWFKAGAVPFQGLIFGLIMADAQQRTIKRLNMSSIQNSHTELLRPCRPGDRDLYLKDASGWQTGASYSAAFGVGENNLTFDVTPPGIEKIARSGAGWLVTLKNACGMNFPAGTPVVENRAGGNGIFLPGTVNAVISNAWTELKGTIKSGDWWPGTAFARVVVIGPGIRRGQTAGILLMDDFDLRVLPDK